MFQYFLARKEFQQSTIPLPTSLLVLSGNTMTYHSSLDVAGNIVDMWSNISKYPTCSKPCGSHPAAFGDKMKVAAEHLYLYLRRS